LCLSPNLYNCMMQWYFSQSALASLCYVICSVSMRRILYPKDNINDSSAIDGDSARITKSCNKIYQLKDRDEVSTRSISDGIVMS
jgi:hypothetical protein